MTLLASLGLPAQAQSSQISPGTTWLDTSGRPIQAHGGGMIKVQNTYYWFGEDKTSGSPFQNIKCYSSTDLTNWTFVNNVLTRQASGDLGPNRVVERPKVLFNSGTSTYVMYLHIDDSSYADAKVGVATSSSVCGTYSYRGSSRPLGFQSRDIGLFQDSDGSGYLLTEDRANGLRIDRLSADYLSVVSAVAVLPDKESPALVKVGSTYFMFCSSLTGWNPNDNQYATASSLSGPWTTLTNFAPAGTNTFTSQVNYVLPVTSASGTSYVYMGDRWNPSNLSTSTYVWLPMSISGNRVSTLAWYDHWTIDTGSPGTTYSLTVSKGGTGGGTITSSAGGINCGSTCSATLASGTTVTLTAAAASGSSFTGWSGACTGTGSCIVTLTANQSVSAGFTVSTQGGPISISAGGAASGAFVADTNYSGGSTYSTSNAIDTSQLTGTVPPQSVLQHERYGSFTYTIPGLTAGAPYSVTLYFAESYWTAAGKRLFNVAVNGAGVLSAFDIYAAAGGANKAVARTFNTTASSSGQVVIAFTPGSIDNPKVDGLAVASGSTSTNYTLTVTKSGTGAGTVAGGAISCGSSCSASLASGTTVTLTATPGSGSTFASWGGACTGTGSCVVTMTAAQTVTATFNTSSVDSYALTVIKAGTGSGTVTSSTGGISCGSACSATLASGTTVTLTATSASGSTFAGWSGACTGTGACAVTVIAAQSVTATFTANGGTCTPVTGGQSGNFNTTGAVCYAVSATVHGWGCSNADGRTVTVNGTAVTCGQTPLPGSSPYTFSFTAGSYPWASFYWW